MLTKIALPLVVAALVTTALSGCVGGAQNLNAAGSNGDKNTPGDNGQQGGSSCGIALDTALSVLTKASDEGKVDVGFASEGDGGWYVAGPIGDTTVYSDVIGLWATTDDPTSTEFDGEFYSLNQDARTATSVSTAVPTAFHEDSTAGKKALACAKAASK